MRIRPFKSGDEPKLAEIFLSAVHEISRHHYAAQQVAAWAAEVPNDESFAVRAIDGRVLLVAVDSRDTPLAYADFEPDGRIDHIYCRSDVAGTGVTTALYEKLEAAAGNAGITLLYVEASKPARRFFLKRGFHLVGRRDFELNGAPIHNFRMEKHIR